MAHEINNPIAVMQGNLEIIRDLMGPKAEEAKTELIDEQMSRVSGIVTRQGGKITAESEPGKGTAFTVWLPSAD